MKKVPILFFFAIFIFTLRQVCTAEERNIDGKPKQNRLERIQELRETLDMMMSFYGKVIDQENKPVSDAEVFISVRRSTSDDVSYVIKTDNKGLFHLQNEKGHLIFINKIKKNGYEYKYENNPVKGVWADEIRTGKFKPEPLNPVIYKMRKKEPAEYVIPGDFRFTFNANETEKEVDLVARQFGRIGVLGTRDWIKGEHADLRIKAELDRNSKYVLTLSIPDTDSGLIMSDELLYVAPAEGYVSSQTLKIPVPGDLKRRFYVKGRQGKIYSRLDVGVLATNEKLGVSILSWTNPNGSRNVDYDAEVYGREEIRKYQEEKRKAIEREKKKQQYRQ